MLSRLRFEFIRLSTLLAERLRNNFYLYLAALLTLAILLDAAVFHVGANMKQKAFDVVIKNRIFVPKPDPEIVIVDVNEASLAALAPDYGRWPWPRQVFGEFLEHLEEQQPKAVVFDILFSDADIYNPDSDAYFNDAIASTDNTFFPFLRLPESQDGLSQVKPGMIPGAKKIPGVKADPAATIAVVLPHFPAALQAGRLGTHNIFPDPDGIVREYKIWQDKQGWRLPSLPLDVGLAIGGKAPPQDSLLLNWRGGPFTYRYVSFSDVYRDMTAKTPKRPANEFAGKIVIIGSTAPSLFDLKATTMAKAHPGVEILATAIDNIKHNDPLKFWRGNVSYVLLSLLVVWLTAFAFFQNIERDRFDRIFGASQLLLLAISYIGVNLANIYLDLTGPVTWAVAYFSIAKIYALATDRAMQRVLASELPTGEEVVKVSLMLVLFDAPLPLGDAALKKIRRTLRDEALQPCRIDELKGTQSGVWGLFADMLAVSWTQAGPDIEKEAERLLALLPAILARQGVAEDVRIRHIIQHGAIRIGVEAAGEWRILFAQAVTNMEKTGVLPA
ncbi:molecular chaperone TorD [Novimethylophilus kurashikiensis]|uniref:Molecular chaperone TorD n=1 Tax=Novimethylophilus kurashikiensis TaxID=1825523 RepID=A0A2R5F715_9PROT|nr:CHASE2 domain-containing protein [Novimethylophilus kurashikiensis]GBG12703.1 molecular chaperone TorD [Novimethylophilus kurashikiensis]